MSLRNPNKMTPREVIEDLMAYIGWAEVAVRYFIANVGKACPKCREHHAA